jgi:hypothetical protein
MRELANCYDSVFVSCCCEQPVAEAAESSGTQRKGWKPLTGNG